LAGNRRIRGDLQPAGLQDWLALHLAVRLGRLDRLKWVKAVRQALVSRIAREPSAVRFATPYGFDLMLPVADQGMLIMALATAHLHPRIREVLEASIRPGDIVIDGGSNVGFFSLLAAVFLKGSGQVVAFEPEPSAFRLLRQNVERNGFQSIVRLEEKALTNSNGFFEFSVVPDEPMRSSLVAEAGPMGRAIRVLGVRLDDYVKTQDLKSVDIIKLDLEGAEPLALSGMEKSLLTARLLVFEINGPLLKQMGVEPLDLVLKVSELGSFKQISFVDEQENRAYPWNVENFKLVLRDRGILDIVCTKDEIHLPSWPEGSRCTDQRIVPI